MRTHIVGAILACGVWTSSAFAGYALQDPVNNIDPSGLDVAQYDVPVEGFWGWLGFRHSYLLIGQPGDFFYDQVEFGPEGGQALYKRIGAVDFSKVQMSEVRGRLLRSAKLTPLQDIQLLMKAQGLGSRTRTGGYPYSTVPGLGGNNCNSFIDQIFPGSSANQCGCSPF